MDRYVSNLGIPKPDALLLYPNFSPLELSSTIPKAGLACGTWPSLALALNFCLTTAPQIPITSYNYTTSHYIAGMVGWSVSTHPHRSYMIDIFHVFCTMYCPISLYITLWFSMQSPQSLANSRFNQDAAVLHLLQECQGMLPGSALGQFDEKHRWLCQRYESRVKDVAACGIFLFGVTQTTSADDRSSTGSQWMQKAREIYSKSQQSKPKLWAMKNSPQPISS